MSLELLKTIEQAEAQADSIRQDVAPMRSLSA